MEVKLASTKLRLILGDITDQDTEAIVNTANTGLWGGSGVDGAIHRVGGPAIMEECARIRHQQGGCPTGEAVITGGGNLKAGFVIHTVGPVWSGGGQQEELLLRNAYYNSLMLAQEKGILSIAFPSISTGAYRFPVARAAKIALQTVVEFLKENQHFSEIKFVLFKQKDLEVYEEALKELLI